MEKLVKKIFEGYKEFLLKDGKGKLKTLAGLLIRYELFVLKWSLLIPIILIDWLVCTYPGLAVMTFLSLFFSAIPYPGNYMIFVIFSDILSTSFLCLILAQFEISRKYLILLIGEENYKRYVGENPGSTLGKKLLYTGGFIMAIGLGKIGLDVTQTYANSHDASLYADTCSKKNIPVDAERFHKHFDRRPGDFIKDIYKNVPKK